MARGFRLSGHEYFEIALQLDPEFYLGCVLTESNVANAGEPLEGIRAWCKAMPAPVFGGMARDAVFRGYIAYLKAE